MADVPEDLEPLARQMWDLMQSIAVRIASMPLEQREAAFDIAERSIRQLAKNMKIADGDTDDFVNGLMDGIRRLVTESDVGGSPQGGRA